MGREEEKAILKKQIADIFKGGRDTLTNSISSDNLKNKLGGRWLNINGERYYQEAEWGKLTYTYDQGKKITIGKLKIYHIDNSVQYLYQEGNFYNSDFIGLKNSISKFDFGKNKGESVFDITVNEPGYILWCIVNLSYFVSSEKLLNILIESINDRKNETFLKAIELNLVKLQLIEMYADCLDEMHEDEAQAREDETREDATKSDYRNYGYGEGDENDDIGYWNTD